MSSGRRESALTYVAEREDEILDFTKTLIRTPSPNPPGDETAVAEVVVRRLRELGIDDIQVVGSEDHRPNIIARIPGTGDGPTLMLSGHLDTKPAGDMDAWETDPWDPVELDGQLWGLGSGDMKAAIAAMTYAGAAAAEVGPLAGDLVLAFTADEEAGSVYGAQWMAENGLLEADVCVIGEPSGITREWESIHLISRGAALFKVKVYGTQQHSSITDRLPNVNSSVMMARLIDRMASQLRGRLTYPEHVLCPSGPTVNVGVMIEGGVFYGVNPGYGEFGCDIRTLPGQTKEMVAADIQAFLDEAMAEDPDLRAEFEWFLFVDATEIPADEPIVRALQTAAADVLDEPPMLDAFPGATDAPHFQLTAGIPTVAAFGPGMLPLAHSPNEYISVAGVGEAARIYALAVVDFLDGNR